MGKLVESDVGLRDAQQIGQMRGGRSHVPGALET